MLVTSPDFVSQIYWQIVSSAQAFTVSSYKVAEISFFAEIHFFVLENYHTIQLLDPTLAILLALCHGHSPSVQRFKCHKYYH